MRKACLQITKPIGNFGVLPLAFDEQPGLSLFKNHEVHLTPIHIAKIPQLNVFAQRIFTKVHPLEKVARHEIFEAWTIRVDERPIKMVVFAFLFHGANSSGSKGSNAKDGIETLEYGDPAFEGLVGYLQIFT